MSQTVEDLVDFLVAVCEEDEDTAYVDALLTAARSALSGSGKGLSSLTGGTVNGRNFSRAIHLSALDVARACQRALALYNDESSEVSSTYADYRSLSR